MVTELLLKQRYREYSDKELQMALAAHVEDGMTTIRNQKGFGSLTKSL